MRNLDLINLAIIQTVIVGSSLRPMLLMTAPKRIRTREMRILDIQSGLVFLVDLNLGRLCDDCMVRTSSGGDKTIFVGSYIHQTGFVSECIEK